MSTELLRQMDAAHASGVPLVGITTADPGATVEALVTGMEALPLSTEEGTSAVYLCWDCARGVRPLNEAAKQAMANSSMDPRQTAALPAMLNAAVHLPENSLLFIYNAHRFLDNPIVMQALWNLRDVFKQNRRMVVLLGPQLSLPRELVQDVVVFDEPMPNNNQIGAILDDVTKAVQDVAPSFAVTDDQRSRAVEALSGMTAFAVEQIAFLAKTPQTYDQASLWERKRKQVEQTNGLSFDTSTLTFDDIGGLARIKQVTRDEFAGPQPAKIVLFIDEIDKALSGTSGERGRGDTSGTSDDAAMVLLTTIENYKWQSKLLVGPPGVAKTLYAKAVAPTFGRQTISLDMGACKGHHVGDSELAIRDAVRTIKAIANGDVLLLATCNRLESLAPEMLRRLRRGGIWYFSLPTDEEKAAIWELQLKAYGLDAAAVGPRPNDTRWSGSDCRDCVEWAWRMRCSLKEAAINIVPVAQTAPDTLERLESMADGKYLSVSYPGVYKRTAVEAGRKRSIAIREATK